MLKRLALVCLLLACTFASATSRQKLQGYCQNGGTNDVIGGLASAKYFMQNFPSCTIAVFDHGTSNLSTIYSDNSGTPLANPFTASNTGLWGFYAANGRYDVRESSGGILSPFTLSDFQLLDITGQVCSVTDYGALGNGTTDDGPAFNSALSACVNVTVPYSASGYKLATTVNIPFGATLDCNNNVILHTSNSTTILLASGTDDWIVRNCIIQGQNGGTVAAVQTAEIDFSILGGHRWRAENVTAKNSDGWGIKRDVGTDSATAVHGDRGQAVNIVAKNSYTGIEFPAGTSAEYTEVSNCDAVSNTNGVVVAAGNTTITNCNITDNVIGVWLKQGANHGHGIIANSNINHNTTDNVFVDTMTNGFTFANDHFYANANNNGWIHLSASNSVMFTGSMIDSNIKNDSANGSNNFFLGNTMVSNVATAAPAGTSGATNLVLSANTIPSGNGWWAYNNAFDVSNGTISAGTRAAEMSIGDISASRNTTIGVYTYGSDGNKYGARVGNQLQWGGFTSIVPASASLSSIGTNSLPFSTAFFSGQILTSVATGTAPLSIASTTPVANLALSGCTGCTITGFDSLSAKSLISTVATGTAPLTITSTTPVTNLTGQILSYNIAGVQLTNSHSVIGVCTLGTSCAISLTGAAAFTTSGTYFCWATDTTAAAATAIAYSSGSAFTITGTGTDIIRFGCIGN